VSFGREGGLARAAEACNGNAACRSDAGTMCPSFQALHDERHSTRGRAVLLRAALEGRLPDGLADEGLHEALELCLGCKGCAAECPAQVDMARLKVEALAHRHRTHRPGLIVRALADTHRLLAVGSRVPRLAAAGARVAGRLRGGLTPPAPVARGRPPAPGGAGTPVVVMADTFTRFLDPAVGDAAVRVLQAAGGRVHVVDPGCCGRPQFSQGFTDRARASARGAIDRLLPHARAGRRIVVLEPSCCRCWSTTPAPCWATTRRCAPCAMRSPPSTSRSPNSAARNSARPGRGRSCTTTATRGPSACPTCRPLSRASPPSRAGIGRRLLRHGRASVTLHPQLSRTIGESRLGPAAAEADLVVAPGTSCREQVHRASRPARRPSRQYLADHLVEDRA